MQGLGHNFRDVNFKSALLNLSFAEWFVSQYGNDVVFAYDPQISQSIPDLSGGPDATLLAGNIVTADSEPQLDDTAYAQIESTASFTANGSTFVTESIPTVDALVNGGGDRTLTMTNWDANNYFKDYVSNGGNHIIILRHAGTTQIVSTGAQTRFLDNMRITTHSVVGASGLSSFYYVNGLLAHEWTSGGDITPDTLDNANSLIGAVSGAGSQLYPANKGDFIVTDTQLTYRQVRESALRSMGEIPEAYHNRYALLFDGVASNLDFGAYETTFEGKFTVSTWLSIESYGGSDIIWSVGDHLFLQMVGTSDGKIELWSRPRWNGSPSFRSQFRMDSADIPIKERVHLVCTYDYSTTSGVFRFYMNGELLPSTTVVAPAGSPYDLSASTFNLAGYNGGVSNFGHLIVDQCSVFSGVELSLSEIQELYNSGIPIDPSTHSQANTLIISTLCGDYFSSSGDFDDIEDTIHNLSGTNPTINSMDKDNAIQARPLNFISLIPQYQSYFDDFLYINGKDATDGTITIAGTNTVNAGYDYQGFSKLAFDGSTSLIDDDPATLITGEIPLQWSFIARFSLDDWTPAGTNYVFALSVDTTESYRLLVTTGGVIQLIHEGDNDANSWNESPSVGRVDGKVVEVIGVIDNLDVYMYVNGELKMSDTNINLPSGTLGELTIGVSIGASQYLDGNLHFFGASPRALTSEQVAEIDALRGRP